MIKNLPLRLTTVGRIKIGKKGEIKTSSQGAEFQQPEKFDHIVITTAIKDDDENYIPDNNLMDKLKKKGGLVNKDGNLIGVPFRLLYDDVESNFRTRLASYLGKTCVCQGDNETAVGLDGKKKPCPCPKFTDPNYSGKDKCKMNGSLTVMIDEAAYFGQSYIYKTTGKNAVIGMLSSLEMFYQQTSGNLRGLPLMLKMDPVTTVTPQNIPVTIWVLSICFNGTMRDMFQEVLAISKDKKQFQIELDKNAIGFDPEEDKDFAEEFYPDTIEVEKVTEKVKEPEVKKEEVVEILTETEAPEAPEKESEPNHHDEDDDPFGDGDPDDEADTPEEKKIKSDLRNAELLERLSSETDIGTVISLVRRLRKDILIPWLTNNYANIPGKKPTTFSRESATLKMWQTHATKLIRENGNLACASGDTGNTVKEKVYEPPVDSNGVLTKEVREEYKQKYASIPEMAPALGFINQDSLLNFVRKEFPGKAINGHLTIPELWEVAAKLYTDAKETEPVEEKTTKIPEGVKLAEPRFTPPDVGCFDWDDGPVLGNPNTDQDTAKLFSEMKTGKELHGYDSEKWAEIVSRYKDADGKPHKSARHMTFKQAEHLIANLDIPF